MADTKRTQIAELGEFGLIDHLTKELKPQNASTLYGVGDDCAVAFLGVVDTIRGALG